MARFREFCVPIPRPFSLLDVGGTVGFWQAEPPPELCHLTIINTFAQEPVGQETVLIGDGCRLPFGDKSFDLVFSNSAIAFVGGWLRQRLFASEISRVGKAYFVQTPNFWYPIDWRTLVPFFHWLPDTLQARIHTLVRVGRYRRIPELIDAYFLATRVNDLTREQFAACFPDATLESERTLGLAKSFIAHHRDEVLSVSNP